MAVVLLETAAEPVTLKRQQMMTSVFLLMTLGLHGTVSYVDVSRQNNVIGDENNTGKEVYM